MASGPASDIQAKGDGGEVKDGVESVPVVQQSTGSSTETKAVVGQPAAPASPAGTIKALPEDKAQGSTAGRAFQDGIKRENLEQEVEQVMGTLNSWWGGVKKQSASAFTSLKADLDKTVTQAQADFEYLRTAKVEIVAKTDDDERPVATDKGKGKGKATDDPVAAEQPSTSAVEDAATNLFDRLSLSTSKLQSTIQTTFQSTLASAASNPALSNPAQLRDQLAANLHLQSAKQNLQLSMKQAEKLAEEYMKKGDQWVKDAEKWMGDAVKIVPPEDGDTRFIATSWDGADFYAFSTSTPTVKDDGDSRTPRPSVSNPALLAGSRKEALLTRLREDKDLLLVDPEGEGESAKRQDEFRQWVKEKWPSASKDKEVAHVGAIRMALVPEHLTDEQFWQRYLFHKEMIEAEDERRKKLLEATEQSANDDFSWDDEPEAEDTTTPLASSRSKEAKDAKDAKETKETKLETPAHKSIASAATSPRDSEESYDLVSDQGKKTKPAAAAATTSTPTAEEDDDSDWE